MRILLLSLYMMLGAEAFVPFLRSTRSYGIVLRSSEAEDEKREPMRNTNGDSEMSDEEKSEILDAKMEQVPRMAEFDPVGLPDEVAEGSTRDNDDDKDDKDVMKRGNETKNEETTNHTTVKDAEEDREESFDPVVLDLITSNNATKDNVKSEKESKADGQKQEHDNRSDQDSKDEAKQKADNISFLQTLGAITGRGEFANSVQKRAAAKTIAAIEAVNPTERPITSEHIYGRWELLYCSTQLFRSSPFFMAGRAVCKTDLDRDRFNWFCDMHRQALAISSIQAVRQIITKSGRIVSEFEVTAGAVPFLGAKKGYSGGLPLAIEGALVSSADWVPTENSTAMELFMDTVEVKGSNLPFLRLILDQDSSKLHSRKLARTLERVIPSYKTPKPIFKTTYLDESLRISRDQDDNVFVYVKTSEDDHLTNYSDRESDLGVKKLVYGFRKVLFP